VVTEYTPGGFRPPNRWPVPAALRNGSRLRTRHAGLEPPGFPAALRTGCPRPRWTRVSRKTQGDGGVTGFVHSGRGRRWPRAGKRVCGQPLGPVSPYLTTPRSHGRALSGLRAIPGTPGPAGTVAKDPRRKGATRSAIMTGERSWGRPGARDAPEEGAQATRGPVGTPPAESLPPENRNLDLDNSADLEGHGEQDQI